MLVQMQSRCMVIDRIDRKKVQIVVERWSEQYWLQLRPVQAYNYQHSVYYIRFAYFVHRTRERIRCMGFSLKYQTYQHCIGQYQRYYFLVHSDNNCWTFHLSMGSQCLAMVDCTAGHDYSHWIRIQALCIWVFIENTSIRKLFPLSYLWIIVIIYTQSLCTYRYSNVFAVII